MTIFSFYKDWKKVKERIKKLFILLQAKIKKTAHVDINFVSGLSNWVHETTNIILKQPEL